MHYLPEIDSDIPNLDLLSLVFGKDLIKRK